MSLANLKIINGAPSRSKIKDALVELPDEVILKIISDYNEQNNLKPIYKNTPENIELLKTEGKEVSPKTEDNFAFLTPNRYGGVEGVNDLSETVDYDTELVPFVEANYTTYEKDLGINDEYNPMILNADWLKHHWKKIPFGKKEERLAQLNNIIAKVDKADEKQLLSRLKRIKGMFEDDDIDYNQVKQKFIEAFKDNVQEDEQEISLDEKEALKTKAEEAYKNKYNEEIKYSELPNSWKEKLDEYLNSGRKKKFVEQLERLTSKDEVDKSLGGLKEAFEEIFGFELSKDNVKQFAYDNDVNKLSEFWDCIKATFEAYDDSGATNPTYEEAIKYFKTIKSYPDYYRINCKKWYDPSTEEEKERETVGEARANVTTTEIENEISTKRMLEAVKADPEQNAYYEKNLQAHKNLLARGEITEETAKKQMKYVIKYCYEKIKQKNRSNYQKLEDLVKNLLPLKARAWLSKVCESSNFTKLSDKNRISRMSHLKEVLEGTDFKNALGDKKLEELVKQDGAEEKFTNFFNSVLGIKKGSDSTAIKKLFA